MKRNPRKMRWTGAYRRTHGKELTVDKTFEFERKQNRPVKYDRDLYLKTIKAMKRIQQIRLRRERMHYRKRIHDAKVKLNEFIAKVSLLSSPQLKQGLSFRSINFFLETRKGTTKGTSPRPSNTIKNESSARPINSKGNNTENRRRKASKKRGEGKDERKTSKKRRRR